MKISLYFSSSAILSIIKLIWTQNEKQIIKIGTKLLLYIWCANMILYTERKKKNKQTGAALLMAEHERNVLCSVHHSNVGDELLCTSIYSLELGNMWIPLKQHVEGESEQKYTFAFTTSEHTIFAMKFKELDVDCV